MHVEFVTFDSLAARGVQIMFAAIRLLHLLVHMGPLTKILQGHSGRLQIELGTHQWELWEHHQDAKVIRKFDLLMREQWQNGVSLGGSPAVNPKQGVERQ